MVMAVDEILLERIHHPGKRTGARSEATGRDRGVLPNEGIVVTERVNQFRRRCGAPLADCADGFRRILTHARIIVPQESDE